MPDIKAVTMAQANKLLTGHYLGAVTYCPIYCLASAAGNAVAVYSSPVAASFKRNLPGCLELARLYKSPGAAFQTSQFLAETLRWLRVNTDAPCVFSYADPAAKDETRANRAHTGGIYKITGFTFLGASRITDKWAVPGPSGDQIVSAAVCYRRFKTKSREKIQHLNPSWKLIEGEPKMLYVFPLRKRLGPTRKALNRYAACPVDESPPGDASKVQPLEAAPSSADLAA